MSTASKEFNLVRAAFMRRASAPELPASALKLAYVIAFKEMDAERQSTYRRQETLAAALNVDERTVRRLLAILEPLGLSIENGHGPGQASTYRIVDIGKPKPTAPPKSGHQRPVLSGHRRPVSKSNTGHSVHEKRTSESAPLNKSLQEDSLGGSYRTPKGGGERRARRKKQASRRRKEEKDRPKIGPILIAEARRVSVIATP
jgi:hypothetical protein